MRVQKYFQLFEPWQSGLIDRISTETVFRPKNLYVSFLKVRNAWKMIKIFRKRKTDLILT